MPPVTEERKAFDPAAIARALNRGEPIAVSRHLSLYKAGPNLFASKCTRCRVEQHFKRAELATRIGELASFLERHAHQEIRC